MEDRADRDRETVRRVLAGDRNAFADLVSRYQRLVASVAWRYGSRREEVEDVVSEVFIKAFGNLHQYRADHPFSTWLYRLAANHVMDRHRRSRREKGRSEMPAQLVDPDAHPAEDAESGERARLLRACLDEVSRRYREVLFLVYIEGLSVEDCARTLGVPQGTIKSRLLRGRQALKRILERKYPEHFGDPDAS